MGDKEVEHTKIQRFQKIPTRESESKLSDTLYKVASQGPEAPKSTLPEMLVLLGTKTPIVLNEGHAHTVWTHNPNRHAHKPRTRRSASVCLNSQEDN